VDQLAGSPLAKERLRVILEVLTGMCRVQEACARLELSEQRLHQLRVQALTAALDRLEPRPGGRPARPATPLEAAFAEARGRIQDLEVELRAAQVQAELAAALPQVLHPVEEPEAKKGRRRLAR
jgi:hypothetical protein